MPARHRDAKEALSEVVHPHLEAFRRVRPKAMTVAVILAGWFPLFVGAGAGSEVMQRIAAPMLGGMLTAPVLSMVVIPAAFYLVRRRGLRAARGDQ